MSSPTPETAVIDAGLSPRARNALHKLGIGTLGDIRKHCAWEIRQLKNCGRHTVEEILSVAYAAGVEFKPFKKNGVPESPDGRWTDHELELSERVSIARLILGGRFDEAFTRLAAARERWPGLPTDRQAVD